MNRNVLRILALVVFCFSLFYSLGTASCFAQEEEDQQLETEIPEVEISEPEYIQGRILEVLEEKDVEYQGKKQKYQKLKVLVTKGELKGEEITVENGVTPEAQVIEYRKGDRVMIAYSQGLEGEDVFYISDYVRTGGVAVLLVLFTVLSIIVGARKGFFSLLSMIISFFIIFVFVLPQIQAGRDPVLITILASIVIVPVTFYLSHGFEKKTTVSIVATSLALVLTGLLSVFFVHLTHLSGTATEEALILQTIGDMSYNLRGLLLAGIIIGTLGVMDDITVSQTAIVYQLSDVNPSLTFRELFKRSIQVGKDHIASMINTLMLVYTGASLPLLLLFMNNPRPFGDIINFESIVTEIVRTLVGSIGLMLAVPITTYLACFFVKRKEIIDKIAV